MSSLLFFLCNNQSPFLYVTRYGSSITFALILLTFWHTRGFPSCLSLVSIPTLDLRLINSNILLKLFMQSSDLHHIVNVLCLVTVKKKSTSKETIIRKYCLHIILIIKNKDFKGTLVKWHSNDTNEMLNLGRCKSKHHCQIHEHAWWEKLIMCCNVKDKKQQ